MKPNPLAGDLQQRLRLLQEQLRNRSVHATLSSAIERSLLHNPELAEAYSQIQQAQWSLIAVRRQWYPALGVASTGPAGGLWGYGGSRVRSSDNTQAGTADLNLFESRTAFAPVLNLGWSFFDPSRSPEINAAGENLRSQELLFNVTARNLVLETQLAYFNLQEQQQLISAYEEILAATSNHVKQAEALFNAGNANIADVEQIRTQQFQTISLLIATYLSVIDVAASLARSMALPPGQLALPKDSLDHYGQWDLPLDLTIQQAQTLREEIQSSIAQASTARWRTSALFNRYWPRFGLAANGSYANSTIRSGWVGGPVTNELRSSRWDGAFGATFNWAIFDGGIAAAEAQAARAQARRFSDQAAVQRLQISEEVESSYASYATSRLALLSSRAQMESSRLAALAVRERFNVGFADTTSVVQTLNQAIVAANAFARSQREYNSSVARLYRVSAQWPEHTLALRDERVRVLMLR